MGIINIVGFEDEKYDFYRLGSYSNITDTYSTDISYGYYTNTSGYKHQYIYSTVDFEQNSMTYNNNF